MANGTRSTSSLSGKHEFSQGLTQGASKLSDNLFYFPEREEDVEVTVQNAQDGLGCVRAIRFAFGLEALMGLLIYGLWRWLH